MKCAWKFHAGRFHPRKDNEYKVQETCNYVYDEKLVNFYFFQHQQKLSKSLPWRDHLFQRRQGKTCLFTGRIRKFGWRLYVKTSTWTSSHLVWEGRKYIKGWTRRILTIKVGKFVNNYCLTNF